MAMWADEVIEFGPPNGIHQVNENIALSDLFALTDLYTDLLHLYTKQYGGTSAVQKKV